MRLSRSFALPFGRTADERRHSPFTTRTAMLLPSAFCLDFGASTAFAAFIVTMIATLRARLARKTRIALWTLVVLSLACWLYVWISFSVVVQVPPLIPL